MPTHTHTDLVPDWLTARAAKHLRSIFATMLERAGIQDNTHHTFLTEADVRKRKNMVENSLIECIGRGTAPTNLVFAVAGKNARDDLAFISAMVSKRDVATIRQHIESQHCGVWLLDPAPRTVNTVTPVNPVPEATVPDDTTILLLLDAIQTAGGEITRKTLDTILARDFPTNGTELVNHITQRTDYLTMQGTTVTLTPSGITHLHPPAPVHATASPPSAPSQFDILRQAVIDARTRAESLQKEHEESTTVRNAIGTELANAKNALRGAEKTVLELQTQLTEAKSKYSALQKAVLELQDRFDRQPTLHIAYTEALTALKNAEEAYTTYTAL